MSLTANKITKKFFRKTSSANFFYALEETNLELEKGKLTVVTGRSGSGKTTLLTILAGLLSPSEGEVLIDNKSIYSLPDKELSKLRNEKIGFIPQDSAAIFSLNVLENVLLPIMMYRNVTDEDREYALSLLGIFDIDSLSDAMPGELSGGELRRMSIARALVNKPEFIFADEPTGDLDDENTLEVLKYLKGIAESGIAVIMVTHENEALSFADKAYRMSGGRLTEEKVSEN
ncbi:MAG: ABC transporter ATP-binding protein [Ruminococcus sp.]|nr:ABC transporter ATP-binding protein [Ruminococcus sp.]